MKGLFTSLPALVLLHRVATARLAYAEEVAHLGGAWVDADGEGRCRDDGEHVGPVELTLKGFWQGRWGVAKGNKL